MASLPAQEEADAAGSALQPMDGPRLRDELDAGARESLAQMRDEQARKQAEWLGEMGGGGELARYAIKGSDAEWDAALGGGGAAGAPPGHVSLKSHKASASGAAGGADGKSPKHGLKDGKQRKHKDGGEHGGGAKKRRKSE